MGLRRNSTTRVSQMCFKYLSVIWHKVVDSVKLLHIGGICHDIFKSKTNIYYFQRSFSLHLTILILLAIVKKSKGPQNSYSYLTGFSCDTGMKWQVDYLS